MKNNRNMMYPISLIPGSLVIAGNLSGGLYILVFPILFLTLYPILDKILKPDYSNEENTNSFFPDFILFLNVLAHTTSIIALFYGIQSGIIVGWSILFASVGTGLQSGISGINVAHELIHRKSSFWKLLGIWNLLIVNYAHFYVEHVKGHHKWVGTKRDPATARKNETVYFFIFRTIPQQFISAIQIETRRLEGQKKSLFGIYNHIIQLTIFQILIAVSVYLFLGFTVLAAYLIQSLIAILLLEMVNYIEHYGLSRDEAERVDFRHSWQSDSILSRGTLVDLTRHSDHHANASIPYHQLKSHKESPELPGGYFSLFYPALIPPVWFGMMNPKVEMLNNL